MDSGFDLAMAFFRFRRMLDAAADYWRRMPAPMGIL